MLSYELTPDADADLEDIARYTNLEWGPDQAALYIDKLHQGFHEIATKHAMNTTFHKRLPQVFVTHCEHHHYVFYLRSKKTKPVIIAVLHKRMDMLTRLKARLS